MSLKEMSDEIEMLRNKMLKYENEDLKKEIEYLKRHQSDYEISVANNVIEYEEEIEKLKKKLKYTSRLLEFNIEHTDKKKELEQESLDFCQNNINTLMDNINRETSPIITANIILLWEKFSFIHNTV
jgi:hypothetical protein